MANTILGSSENPTGVYLRAGLLGFVTGLRSMTPLALLNWTKRIGIDADSTVDKLLDAPATRTVSSLLAVGELIGDKLPITPSRIAAGPFIGRVAIGALVGAAICQRSRLSPYIGAALGATTASAGAAAGYYGRKNLDKVKFVPDFIWAGMEDLLALALGYFATRKPKN